MSSTIPGPDCDRAKRCLLDKAYADFMKLRAAAQSVLDAEKTGRYEPMHAATENLANVMDDTDPTVPV